MSWEFNCLIKVVVDFNPDRFMSEYNFSMLSRGISKKKSTECSYALPSTCSGTSRQSRKIAPIWCSCDYTGDLKVVLFARVDWNLSVKHPCSVINGLFLRWSFLAAWNWANNWLRRFNQSLRPLVQWRHTTPPPMDWSTLSRSTQQSKEAWKRFGWSQLGFQCTSFWKQGCMCGCFVPDSYLVSINLSQS